MKATSSGVAVGIALDNFDGSTSTTTQIVNGQEVKIGKTIMFVNLGYSKLDDSISSLASNQLSVTNNAWSIDQQSGKVNVNFFGDLNLNSNAILNASKILGTDGKWRIDESGNLTAETVTAKKLCLEDVCIEKEQLKTLLQNAGLLEARVNPDPKSDSSARVNFNLNPDPLKCLKSDFK